jgi:tetratricopeptide (TPR) repeat protein
LGETWDLGLALLRQGRVLTTMGQLDEAEVVLADSFAVLQASYDPRTMGAYWGAMGFLRMRQGDVPRARAGFEEALKMHRAAGAELAVMVTYGNLADLSWSLGDLEASAEAFRQNVAVIKSSRNGRRTSLGIALGNLAGVLTELGSLDEAIAATREAMPLLREGGFAWLLMDHFALLAALTGSLENAARLVGYADSRFAKRNAQRQANEARAHERLCRLLEQGLHGEELTGLLLEGAELDDESACRLAAESSR